MASLPREAFLSHAADDREIAERLTRVLAAHNVPVWYSQRSVVGAQQWHDEIGAALARCDWFLLLLSPNSVRSKWVKRELLYALQDEGYDGRILPLLFRSCDVAGLSWVISQFQMVSFSGDFETGCRSLLRVWGLGLRSDAPAEDHSRRVNISPLESPQKSSLDHHTAEHSLLAAGVHEAFDSLNVAVLR